jgi:predicted DNA-binding transcriptional regulator YafY
MKPSRVSRVVQMLTTLQSGPPRTATDLSRIFGVSRRTLFRDLKELQNIGIEPLFSPQHQGYKIAPEQFLPPINLNLQEALSILLLVHKMRSQIQLPFKTSALLAALKIESALPPRIRHYCEHALARITAKAGAQAPVDGPLSLDGVFSVIQSSIAQRRKVKIRYDSFFDKAAIDCVLSPLHIFYNQRAWYVIGRSSVHKSIRTFKLNRIKKADILDEGFADGDDFDLADYLGCAWSMIPEGCIHHVRLRFAPKVASNVAEVQWHKSQKVARDPDGSATVEFRVDGLNEITWWILGYGDQVEVLAPAALRQTIARIARNMSTLNSTPAT